MNATILNPGMMVCDSPPLDTIRQDKYNFYNVSVSMDGGFITNATGIFRYYKDPIMKDVDPGLGPLTGKTISKVYGWGF